MSESEPYSIHHVNFPTTDPERTKDWYMKVFGMKHQDVSRFSDTKVLLMTRGKFDLHFTPVEAMDRMAPYHFAIEVEDWDGFIKHLEDLKIRYTKPVARPAEQFDVLLRPGPRRDDDRTRLPRQPGLVGNRCPLPIQTAPRSITRSTATGPAVLFVHGSGGHHAAWWQQVPYFTKQGYTVVTLDLRGFGRSTSELDEYDSLEFPGDILAVLDGAGHRQGSARRPVDRRLRGTQGRRRPPRPCRRGGPCALAGRARQCRARRAGQGRPCRGREAAGARPPDEQVLPGVEPRADLPVQADGYLQHAPRCRICAT